jgi:hypothetical protein
MLVALGTALLLVGSTCAQTPQAAAPAPPPPPPDSAMTGDWWNLGDWELPAQRGQFWGSADLVAGWFSGDRLPALVTTSPPGTPMASAGITGQKTTAVLFGDSFVNDDTRAGFRLGAGYWLTPERTFGIEASLMILESQASLFSATSNGSPILARPFFDIVSFSNQAVLVAFPGSSSGSITARAASGEFYQGNIDFTENVCDKGWFRFDSLLGYRFFRYDEGLRIRQSITGSPNFATGTAFTSEDDFSTLNEFHGADFGFRTQFNWEDFSVALLTKLGVGCVNRTVKITGGQSVTVPGSPPANEVGGLLALSSNIGNHHSNDWTILPELGATFSWRVNQNVRVGLGYSILLLNDIARAADQVDLVVNPQLFPGSGQAVTGSRRPIFNLNRIDATLQTVGLEVEFTY